MANRGRAANTSSKRGDSWAPFLLAIRDGYADYMANRPWPPEYDTKWGVNRQQQYEWGRYLAAELAQKGIAPTHIFIDKMITKEWKLLLRQVPEWHNLIRQHFRKVEG